MVSIIMPCYNSEKYVTASIESVLCQSMSSWELLIIDDGSVDGTKDIIEKYSRLDPRISIYHLDRNSGVASARNVGLINAKFKYVAFIDSDDLWCKDKLSIQITVMEQRGLYFSYTDYYIIDEKGVVRGGRKSPPQLTYNKLLRRGNDIGCLTVVYNREVFVEMRFNKNIHGHEDYKMWLEIVKSAGTVYCIGMPLAYYRVHSGSKNLNKLRSLRWNWEVWRKYEGLGLFSTVSISIRWVIHKFVQRLMASSKFNGSTRA